MNKLSCIKNVLLSVMVTSAFGVSAADLTVALGKGQQITLVKQGNQYSAKNINKIKSLGHFSKAFLSPSGEAVYLIWDGQKVDILNFGTYEKLWESSADEQAFIDFLKSSKQTEFLAMLTIAKREYFQKMLENKVETSKVKKDWSYFVGINLQYSNPNIRMKDTLLQVGTLAFYLDKNIDTIKYYDDFDQAPTSYTPDFKRILWYTANIAQSKAEIAQSKAEIAKLDKSIAQNKAEMAQYKAVIEAYKKVMWVLREEKP